MVGVTLRSTYWCMTVNSRREDSPQFNKVGLNMFYKPTLSKNIRCEWNKSFMIWRSGCKQRKFFTAVSSELKERIRNFKEEYE